MKSRKGVPGQKSQYPDPVRITTRKLFAASLPRKNPVFFFDKEKQKKIHKAALMPPQDLNLFRRGVVVRIA